MVAASSTSCLVIGAFAPSTAVASASVAPASSPAAISAVGSPYITTGATTLSVSPQKVGDLMTVALYVDGSTPETTVDSVTGGGVNNWLEDTAVSEDGYDGQIWWGVVTSAGSSTVTLSVSGSYVADEIVAQEFGAVGTGVRWSAGEAGHSLSTTSTVTFPALTPTSSSELYFGYGLLSGTGLGSCTGGFIYTATPDGDVLCWDTDVSSTAKPSASQTSLGSVSVAGLFAATTGGTTSPAPISAIGPLDTTTGATTLSVSPVGKGDLIVLALYLDASTVETTVESVTGGGVSNWAEDTTFEVDGDYEQIWWGVVTSTGASTITLNLNGSYISDEVVAQEFRTAVGATWSAAAAGHSFSPTASVSFPSLTPASPGELYFGYGVVTGIALAGCTSGFSYATTPDGDVLCWDTDVSSTVKPTASQSGQGSATVAGLFVASEVGGTDGTTTSSG
jgi:hypothetical protein